MCHRVVVTDAHGRATVAAARCLARAGYEVLVTAHERPALAHRSRWCSERPWVPDPRSRPEAFTAALAGLAGDALLPATDISVVAVSEHRHLLGTDLSTDLPDHATVMWCMDKAALLEVAGPAGLTAPESILCRGRAAARAAAGELGFPVMLKSRHSVYRLQGRLARRGSELILDPGHLDRRLPAFGDQYLLQRPEPGAVISCAGVAADDRLLGVAVSRYERTWPPLAGNVSTSVTVAPRPDLLAATRRLLDGFGWRGIFELELIERPDGSLAAIDFNPRPYGSMALAADAGAPLASLWAGWLLRAAAPPETIVARPGVRYRWEEGEARNLLRAAGSRQLRGAGRIVQPRRQVVHALYRHDDPGPFLARAGFLATRLGGRRTRARPAVAVVGAGPYGLAAAAHLRHAGLDVHVFGEAMEFWRTRMPERMLLRSSPRASHIADPERRLTLDHYGRERDVDVPYPLPVDRFLDYASWFQSRAVPEVDPRRVRRITAENGSLALELSDREEASFGRIVLAAGLSPFANRPSRFDAIPPSAVSHTSDHVDFARVPGRRVLVVGAGQSGLEAAAELHEAGRQVEVLARRAEVVWLSGLRQKRGLRFPLTPTDIGGRLSGWVTAAPDLFRRLPEARQANMAFRCIRPAGAAWLRDRLKGVPVIAGRTVESARPAGDEVEVRLDDGEVRAFDHVLLATGFRIDVARYPFLDRDLIDRLGLRNGYPPLGPGLESAVPGLHFVGAPAAMSFGPVMRFVVGTWYAAPAVARAAAGRHQPPLRWSF